MRPLIEKEKKFKVRFIIYAIIIIVCVISIGIAVYLQFFKDEKLGVIFGITQEEEDTEYIELKENFLNIFDNTINVLENYNGNITKIRDGLDIIAVAYESHEQKDNYRLNMQMPCLNIKTEEAIEINKNIYSIFKEKAESILATNTQKETIYTVKYKAYLYNNILSLVILSELKEGTSSQRIIIQTYNYDLENNKKIDINYLLNHKNIEKQFANEKIKEEIDLSQKQNLKLQELGYKLNIRDSNSSKYDIENAEVFFIGENGYLYVIYAYGNEEFTSEMDVVILK